MKLTAKNTSRLANYEGLVLGLFLIAACVPFPADSEELGRLFFTPERRQLLDRQRQFNIQERKEVPEDPMLTINGVVTRSSGKRTVWINGVAQNDSNSGRGVTASPTRTNPGKVVIQPDGGPAANASVGDTISRNTGDTAELLQGGKIVIRRPPSEH